jgi:long-chain acyl-CoA synthetase
MEKPWLKHYDPGVPEHLVYPSVPLYRFLEQAAEQYPEQICTRLEEAVVTYQQMEALTTRLAGGLVRWGVKPGERIGILLPNLPQFVAAFYAILKAGGVVVAINPSYKAREVESQINDSGVKALVVLDSAYDMMQPLVRRTSLERVLVTREEDARLVGEEFLKPNSDLNRPRLADGDMYLDQLTRPALGDIHLPPIGPEDNAIFQFTGGTTGIPKGAIGLHRNLVTNTLQFRHWLVNLKDGRESMLIAIPMFHVYGMVLGMSLAVALGSPMVLVPNPRNLEALLGSIQHYQPTVFPGVPSLYNAINHNQDVQQGKYDLRSIKACISGSAPLHHETKEQFEALTGGKLVEGYGLSEAPTATHCNPILGENRTGSIGLPLSDVEARIVSIEDQRSSLLPGEIGELAIRGPQVMKGYYHRVEDTEAVLRDGWLYTGDIARMDADGYFYIVDRKKEMIKVSGLQVWPREVEEVLASHPKVQEVGVSGIPDAMRGETVKAWVVLKSGEAVSSNELIGWAAENLAHFKVPTDIEFRDELPKTTVGKILRRELLRQHLERLKL